MLGSEIVHCLKDLKIFFGVYSLDTLPKRIPRKRPYVIICNTDKRNMPGEHWVAIAFRRDQSILFDSLGISMPFFRDFLNKHCNNWIYINKPLQSIFSDVCGQYCCLFTLFLERTKKLDFINFFDSDSLINDLIICSLFAKYFNFSVKGTTGQFCNVISNLGGDIIYK